MSENSTTATKRLMPTIIGVADSTLYLVGGVDEANNFVGLNGSDNATLAMSLSEAKRILASQNISSATLEFQSAYDEMCGLQSAGIYRETIRI